MPIEILVFYTPEVASSFSISNLIGNIELDIQESFTNSNIGNQISIITALPIQYSSQGNAQNDLSYMMGNNEIQNYRKEYAGDICVLLVDDLNGVNGEVPVGSIPSNVNNSFAVVEAGKAYTIHTFIHEVGHLFGCRHDNDNTISNAHGAYFNEQFTYKGVTHSYFETIMSRMSKSMPKYTRLPFFTNPYKSLDDPSKKMGNTEDEWCSRQVDSRAEIIGYFGYSSLLSGPQSLENDGTGIFTCTAKGGAGSYSYKWEIYKFSQIRAYPSDQWIDISNNSPTYTKNAPNNGDYRTFKLRCTITDINDQSVTSEEFNCQYIGDVGQKIVATENQLIDSETKEITDNLSVDNITNFPNPFNPTTKIEYSIKENSSVKIVVYNMLGQEIKTLVNGEKSAGTYYATFDATGLPSGMYYCKMVSNNFNKTIKMLLTK